MPQRILSIYRKPADNLMTITVVHRLFFPRDREFKVALSVPPSISVPITMSLYLIPTYLNS